MSLLRRTSASVIDADPHGQVALMLCEALMHVLVERGVIAKRYAVEAIGTVEELVREERGAAPRVRAPSRRAKRANPADLIEAIRASFSAKSL